MRGSERRRKKDARSRYCKFKKGNAAGRQASKRVHDPRYHRPHHCQSIEARHQGFLNPIVFYKRSRLSPRPHATRDAWYAVVDPVAVAVAVARPVSSGEKLFARPRLVDISSSACASAATFPALANRVNGTSGPRGTRRRRLLIWTFDA